jgi:type IV secretion system protein TrbL
MIWKAGENKFMRFLFLFILLLVAINVFPQNKITALPDDARTGLSEERERQIKALQDKVIFGKRDGVWFDGAFYKILLYFDNIFLYMMLHVKIIAMICFALSLGIGAVKLIMGGVELNKFLIQHFMALLTFMIIIAIFPIILKYIISVTSSLAYGASFYRPLENEFKNADDNELFKQYLINIAAPDSVKAVLYEIDGYQYTMKDIESRDDLQKRIKEKFADYSEWRWGEGAGMENDVMAKENASTYSVQTKLEYMDMVYSRNASIPNPDQLNSLMRARDGDIEAFISLRIIDKKTGLISLNQLGKISFITLRAIWGNLSLSRKFMDWMGQFVFSIFTSLMYIFCICVGVVNYMMVIVQFGFLYGLGVLFIPMMLWDGTKTMFEKIVGSIMNISVHLLVKTLVLIMVVAINLEICKNAFVLSLSKTAEADASFLYHLEFYFSTLFLTIFLKLFNDQSTAIADFLCGGQPRLSFGEFAQAAASAGAAGMAAGKAGGAIAGGAAKLAMGGAGALAGSIANGNATKAAGGSFWKGAGASLANSAIHGADSLAGSAMKAVGNAPGAAKGLGQLMRYGMHPAAPLSAEGVGIAPKNPFGGGGSSGGGSSGGGGQGKEEGPDMKKMNSQNATERRNEAYGSAMREHANGGASGMFSGFMTGADRHIQAEAHKGAQGPFHGHSINNQQANQIQNDSKGKEDTGKE